MKRYEERHEDAHIVVSASYTTNSFKQASCELVVRPQVLLLSDSSSSQISLVINVGRAAGEMKD